MDALSKSGGASIPNTPPHLGVPMTANLALLTVEVTAQLFARVLFALQVHDGDDHAHQHDHQGRQQNDDPRLAVGRRRIRPGRVRRVHDYRHRGAVRPVPALGVRLNSGREAPAHRQAEKDHRGRRVERLLYGGLRRVVVFHLDLWKKTQRLSVKTAGSAVMEVYRARGQGGD